jgi:CheY-like chemotaxis protein
MLRLALEAQGHTVLEARDQAEALAALHTTHPAIVLSDLRLPDGDRLRRAARRETSLTPSCPC